MIDEISKLTFGILEFLLINFNIRFEHEMDCCKGCASIGNRRSKISVILMCAMIENINMINLKDGIKALMKTLSDVGEW